MTPNGRHFNLMRLEDFNQRPPVLDLSSRNQLVNDARNNVNGWEDRLIDLCKEYYKKEPTGGALHVLLDENNFETSVVCWCEGYASGINDCEAADIASIIYHAGDHRNVFVKKWIKTNKWS